jgi:hypothetical protein
LDRLPKPNGIWSLDHRAKWLRIAASIFGLVYKASDGEHWEISIVFVKHEGASSPVKALGVAEAIAPGKGESPSPSRSPLKSGQVGVCVR